MTTSTKTPTCPGCGRKFPGDPCSGCGKDSITAASSKRVRMPSATRRRRRHGR